MGHSVLCRDCSTCHMALCEEEVLVPGVWGPYYSAMVPGYHLLEGGQSATGKLLDFLIESSDCSSALKAEVRFEEHLFRGCMRDS